MSSARREEKEGSAGQEREGGGSERDGEAKEGDTGKKAHGGGSVENVSQCGCLCKHTSEVLSRVRSVRPLQKLNKRVKHVLF